MSEIVSTDNVRRMRNHVLFYLGILFLLLAFGGLILLSTRSFQLATQRSNVPGENLLRPPVAIPIPTPTPVALSPRLIKESSWSDYFPLACSIPILVFLTIAFLALVARNLWSSKEPLFRLLAALTGILATLICIVVAGLVILFGLIVVIVVTGRNFGASPPNPTVAAYLPTETETTTVSALPTLTPISVNTLVPTLVPTPPPPPPPLIVETEWPATMEVAQSATIRISFKNAGGIFVPTIEVPGNSVRVATPFPIGTPGPIRQALGADYEVCFKATLVGELFKPVLVSPADCLSTALRLPEWQWNITAPSEQAHDVLNASIVAEWKPKSAGQPTQRAEIWHSQIPIQVEKPFLTTGQISLSSLFTGFVGSGLTVPFLYERLKERRGKKAAKDKKENGK